MKPFLDNEWQEVTTTLRKAEQRGVQIPLQEGGGGSDCF
jgi:hypothetical protein